MDKVVQGDLITLDGEDYLILDTLTYNGIDYAFANKMTNDEQPTKEFYTYEIDGDEVSIVEEKEILDIVLPMFSEKIQKIIDNIQENS